MPLPSFPFRILESITGDYDTTTTSNNNNNKDILKKKTSCLERSLAKGVHFSMCTYVLREQWKDPPLHYWNDHWLDPWPPCSHMESHKNITHWYLTLLILSFYDYTEEKLLFYDIYSTKRQNYVILFAPLKIKSQHKTDTW